MKKKICMLTLMLTLSAAALAGCSNTKEGTGEDNIIIEGESESKETITRDAANFDNDDNNNNNDNNDNNDNEDNEDVETDDSDTDEDETAE